MRRCGCSLNAKAKARYRSATGQKDARGAVAALLVCLSPATFGAPPDPPEFAEPMMEEVIVTGTYIPRKDFISASPVLTIGQAVFEQSGAQSVEKVLNLAPQFQPNRTDTSNGDTVAGFGDGAARVDLRGLGTIRTLVLVDGRRLTPYAGDGGVDLNTIPPALIERVEVLTGGATAVYGTDAMAGVVNMRLKHSFHGVEVDGQWGQTERGDAEEYQTGISFGTDFAEGRGELMGYLGYAEREQLNADSRGFSRYPLMYVGPGAGSVGPGGDFVPFGSGIIEEGVATGFVPSRSAFDALFASYGYAPGSVPLQTQFGFNADGSLFTQGRLGAPGSVANFRGDWDPAMQNDNQRYTYNYQSSNALRLPLERRSAFLAGSFDVSAATRLYTQVLYADYNVDVQWAPVSVPNVFVPSTNPYLPADLKQLLDSRADPNAPFLLSRRYSELGPRRGENANETYQLTLGVQTQPFENWDLDVYALYGNNDWERNRVGTLSMLRTEELTFAADGGNALCGGFDPFGKDRISPECARYIGTTEGDRSTYEMGILEARLRGTVLELPGGPVAVVAGVLYREDRFEYRADEATRRHLPDGRFDSQGFPATDDVSGETEEYDLYLEISVPVLANAPFVDSLDLVGGYRYADYTGAGGVDAWKAELMYRPVGSVLLRGSWQRAVRAPSVTELYLPQVAESAFEQGLEDPCDAYGWWRTEGPDPLQVEALCLAQGVPPELLPSFAATDPTALMGGNPNLDVESAETWTAGLVWEYSFTRQWLGELQVALDGYRIEIEDMIDSMAVVDVVWSCFDGERNPDYSPDNWFCRLMQREASNGDIFGVVSYNLNLGTHETQGVDLQLAWSLPVGPGSLSASAVLSWLDYTRSQLGPVGEWSYDLTGYIGAGTSFQAQPEWKSNAALSYAQGGFELGLNWYWIDSMASFYAGNDERTVGEWLVPEYNRYDLWASYRFEQGRLQGLALRLGINNLGDEDPPIYPYALSANTSPSTYDVFGRRFFAGLSYRF